MRRALCLIAGLLVLTVAAAATPPPQTGFLDSYPALQPDPKHEGSFIYMEPGASLKGFTKVQIDPILVWYAKDSTYQGIDPNELSAVTENLRKAVVKNLEPKYPVVSTDGPNVLRLRLAVTNVTAEKKKRGILGYTPVGFIISSAKNAATAGPNLNIASATLEAELLDASGKRLAVVIDPLAGQDVQKENLTWADIGKVLDAAGKRLRARMDSDNPQ
jgi:hypothetical protein